jgi:hypothetical protein
MLFRWFIGLSMDAPVWDVTVFTKNRDRLLRGEVAGKFFAALLADPQVKPLLSSKHFSVGGTLIKVWASMKSFRPKDGSGVPPGPGRNGERDFHGEKRINETHASTTDPDARLVRESNGQASKLCYAGHVVTENRHGLAAAASTTQATGTAERDAGETMMAGLDRAARSTLGGDKNYDTQGLRGCDARYGRDAARGAAHEWPPLGDRRADHRAPRLRGQPAHPRADRKRLQPAQAPPRLSANGARQRIPGPRTRPPRPHP